MTDFIFQNVVYKYPGTERNALDALTLRLESGKRAALIGRNGSGKSTLMKIANGILFPAEGRIIFDGRVVGKGKRESRFLRERVGIVLQNPEDQLFSASVFQDISAGPLNLGLTPEEARRRVFEVATLCGLTELLDRPTHALSGGEKTRAALAGILAMRPRFLFADEITNALDPWMRAQVLKILCDWTARGNTVLLATHDWDMARSWAEEVYWLEDGKVLRAGTPEEVFQGSGLPERYG